MRTDQCATVQLARELALRIRVQRLHGRVQRTQTRLDKEERSLRLAYSGHLILAALALRKAGWGQPRDARACKQQRVMAFRQQTDRPRQRLLAG